MSSLVTKLGTSIEKVAIYTGPGTYETHVPKNIAFFQTLNVCREKRGLSPWQVMEVGLEKLTCLDQPKQTLLVIPAGQSSDLDKVFSVAQLQFLNRFFLEGGRGFFTCGSAYWTAKKRIYHDVSTTHPTERVRMEKESRLPLFPGVAVGPLCPFPGHKYKVGFYSEAIQIESDEETCTTLLSGGGSFLLESPESNVQVLATYSKKELKRLKQPEHLQNAAVLTRVGQGAAVLSMIHPYFDPKDFETAHYQKLFPDAGTDWEAIPKKLSPLEERTHFVFEKLILPLETAS